MFYRTSSQVNSLTSTKTMEGKDTYKYAFCKPYNEAGEVRTRMLGLLSINIMPRNNCRNSNTYIVDSLTLLALPRPPPLVRLTS